MILNYQLKILLLQSNFGIQVESLQSRGKVML